MLFIAMTDLPIFNYSGQFNNDTLDFGDSFNLTAGVYKPTNNYALETYDVGDNVANIYAEDQNLTDLSTDRSFSFNASEKDYVYMKISPRNRYDWSQINLNVINGTVDGAKLIFPAELDSWTADNYINDFDAGERDITSDFAEYYSSGGLPQANLNMSMEFGFISDFVLLELELSTSTPEELTIVNMEVAQYNLSTILVGAEGFPGWAIVLIVVGAVSAGVVVLLVILKDRGRADSR